MYGRADVVVDIRIDVEEISGSLELAIDQGIRMARYIVRYVTIEDV